MDIEKNIIYDPLHHGRQLMEQLGINRGGPCSSPFLEAMEGVMVEKSKYEPVVDNPQNGLPKPDSMVSIDGNYQVVTLFQCGNGNLPLR